MRKNVQRKVIFENIEKLYASTLEIPRFDSIIVLKLFV